MVWSFSVDAMALSDDTLFWSNNTSDSGAGSSSVVFSQRLGSSGRRQVYSGLSVRGLWPLDGREQQYPPTRCLLPGPPAGRPSDIYNKASSVGLQMSPRSPPAECGAVSAAALRYTLHYGPNVGPHRCRDELRFCKNTVSGPNVILWGVKQRAVMKSYVVGETPTLLEKVQSLLVEPVSGNNVEDVKHS